MVERADFRWLFSACRRRWRPVRRRCSVVVIPTWHRAVLSRPSIGRAACHRLCERSPRQPWLSLCLQTLLLAACHSRSRSIRTSCRHKNPGQHRSSLLFYPVLRGVRCMLSMQQCRAAEWFPAMCAVLCCRVKRVGRT